MGGLIAILRAYLDDSKRDLIWHPPSSTLLFRRDVRTRTTHFAAIPNSIGRLESCRDRAGGARFGASGEQQSRAIRSTARSDPPSARGAANERHPARPADDVRLRRVLHVRLSLRRRQPKR